MATADLSVGSIPAQQLTRRLETICGLALGRALYRHLFGAINKNNGGGSGLNGGWKRSIVPTMEMATNAESEDLEENVGAEQEAMELMGASPKPPFRVRVSHAFLDGRISGGAEQGFMNCWQHFCKNFGRGQSICICPFIYYFCSGNDCHFFFFCCLSCHSILENMRKWHLLKKVPKIFLAK